MMTMTMTPTVIFILTTVLSLLVVITIAVAAMVRKRQRLLQKLQQSVQQLQRRELAAANAAQDMRAEFTQLQTSLAHNQRLLMNNLMRGGRERGAATTPLASRDERKLRDLLPQE